MASEVQSIINSISIIFSYFVPGAVFLLFYKTYFNKDNINNFFSISVVISYCICSIENIILSSISFSQNLKCIIYAASGLLLGYIFCAIITSVSAKSIVSKVFKVSPPTNIYLTSIGTDNKTDLTLYMSNGDVIIGHPVHLGKEWLTLTTYATMKEENHGCYKMWDYANGGSKDRTLNIKLKDVERFEAIYDEDSSIRKSFFN